MAQVARDGGPAPKGDFTPKISPVLAVTPIDFNGKIRVYEFCYSWGTLFALLKGELIDQGVPSSRSLGPSLGSWLHPLSERYSTAGHYSELSSLT